MKAIYQPDSGFANSEMQKEEVAILGFVVDEYEPGYQRFGTKHCTLAIIADKSGRIRRSELRFLTYVPD